MSQRFLPTTCPECAGARIVVSSEGGYGPHVCKLCKGHGVVSHFLAAACIRKLHARIRSRR